MLGPANFIAICNFIISYIYCGYFSSIYNFLPFYYINTQYILILYQYFMFFPVTDAKRNNKVKFRKIPRNKLKICSKVSSLPKIQHSISISTNAITKLRTSPNINNIQFHTSLASSIVQPNLPQELHMPIIEPTVKIFSGKENKENCQPKLLKLSQSENLVYNFKTKKQKLTNKLRNQVFVQILKNKIDAWDVSPSPGLAFGFDQNNISANLESYQSEYLQL